MFETQFMPQIDSLYWQVRDKNYPKHVDYDPYATLSSDNTYSTVQQILQAIKERTDLYQPYTTMTDYETVLSWDRVVVKVCNNTAYSTFGSYLIPDALDTFLHELTGVWRQQPYADIYVDQPLYQPDIEPEINDDTEYESDNEPDDTTYFY